MKIQTCNVLFNPKFSNMKNAIKLFLMLLPLGLEAQQTASLQCSSKKYIYKLDGSSGNLLVTVLHKKSQLLDTILVAYLDEIPIDCKCTDNNLGFISKRIGFGSLHLYQRDEKDGRDWKQIFLISLNLDHQPSAFYDKNAIYWRVEYKLLDFYTTKHIKTLRKNDKVVDKWEFVYRYDPANKMLYLLSRKQLDK